MLPLTAPMTGDPGNQGTPFRAGNDNPASRSCGLFAQAPGFWDWQDVLQRQDLTASMPAAIPQVQLMLRLLATKFCTEPI